jgi:hypothetical protein
MNTIIKFISRGAVEEGKPFLVRCTCDALLLAEADRVIVTCETCGKIVTPQLVANTESVSVRDEHSGEWKSYPVQQYRGVRSSWTPKVGDIVGHGPKTHRWKIVTIDGGQAVSKLLGNHKDSGVPMEMHHSEKVPLSALRYTPD